MTCIDIPSTASKIGDSAFYDCASLRQIRIPDSVASIGSSAFELKVKKSLALDGFCPTPGNRIAVMHNFLPEREHVEMLAGFGEARLVRTLDMKYELRGGSAEDRDAAVDWIRKFFPDLVCICSVPGLPANGQRMKKM